MTHDLTIKMLLGSRREEPLSPEQWKRAKARCAWVLDLQQQWYQAMLHRDEVCAEAAERLFGQSPSPLQGRGQGEGDQGESGAGFQAPPDGVRRNARGGRVEGDRGEGGAGFQAPPDGDRRNARGGRGEAEEEFNRLCDAEEAKVAAIKAQIDAVIEHDRWPPHLHWSAI